jgi:5'(3')-deoxyribonucleotidase
MATEYKGKVYDDRHGGPFDRGQADSYYHRQRKPHFFLDKTYQSQEVTESLMSNEQVEAYHAGYDYNEESGDKKDWG